MSARRILRPDKRTNLTSVSSGELAFSCCATHRAVLPKLNRGLFSGVNLRAFRLALIKPLLYFRIYRVERDEETIQAILEKEVAFWDRVKNLNPPDATSVSDIALMFEKDAGTSIEADGKALALFNNLRDMKSRFKELKDEIAVSEEKLKLYMQEHSILTLDGKPICTWKSQVSNRFDQQLFQLEHPDLYKKFKTATTSRVFRMK